MLFVDYVLKKSIAAIGEHEMEIYSFPSERLDPETHGLDWGDMLSILKGHNAKEVLKEEIMIIDMPNLGSDDMRFYRTDEGLVAVVCYL